MATHARTVLSTLCYRRCCCVYLGLLVFIRAAFCVNGSFGNLVTNVTSGSSTTASPSGTDIVRDADPINKCVTYTTSPGSRPYIDVGVGSNSDVRTILVYTRKIDPTPVTVPVVLTDISGYTFTHAFTPFHTDTNTVYIFTGSQTTHYVRVTAAGPSASFTVCMLKVYDVSLSEYCTCDDPCSRNTDYICTATNACITPATTCHGQNLALNKKTNMSSTYKSDDGSFAVNGNTGTTFSGSGYTSDNTQWNCIHTAEGPNHYWQVDLGRSYNVTYLTIYRRSSGRGKNRMKNVKVKVKVDDQLCTTLTDSQIEEERIDVTCTTPLSGQVLKLSRYVRYDFLNLCEVQVWGCEPGYYGHRCTGKCSGNRLGGRQECDVQGNCTKGCEPGYYGHRCTEVCSANCFGGRTECDIQGKCTKGCEDGWYGLQCNTGCPKNCQDKRCAHNTGKCTCVDDWFGPTCNETCSAKCLKCEQTKYNCTQCGTGRYALPGCQSFCSTHCQNLECDTRTGNCSPCTAGWYLPTCTKECSPGCQNQQCDQTTGRCSCQGGWMGDKCDGCIPGKYGTGCQQSCSEGCTDDQCNVKTGYCSCKPGWDLHDPKCDTPCPRGSYGPVCNLTCGICRHGSACEHDTGHCQQGCAEGFKGDTCHEIREGGADGWLVAAVTLAVVVVLMVMTVAIRRYRRKRRHTQRETNEIEIMAAAASADSGAHQSHKVVTADSSVDTGRGSHFYEDVDTVRPAPLLESRARDKTDKTEENYDHLQPGAIQTPEEPYDALKIYDDVTSIEDSKKCAVM